MCLHYLVKLIARVLSPYTLHTFPYRMWTFGIKFSLTLKQQFSTVNNCFCRVYWYGETCRRGSTTRGGLQMLKNFASASRTSWNVLISAVSTAQWRSGKNDCERVLLLKEESLNMNCDSWCNSVVATVRHLIVWLLITFAVTVFSVLWLFQSHAAVVKRYNAFCLKLAANSDTERNNISKLTFPVCVSEHFHS